ncbi:putative LRR receptor-like serine/threonine-protein kinase [Nymphaea thermarum]|nr:putative LRR receptor-like serine/threonine-protein kinase [Nymphaea thermarum]
MCVVSVLNGKARCVFFYIVFSWLCAYGFIGSHGTTLSDEIEALMEMKTALDPRNRILSSWSSDADPCSGAFLGVACNEQGKVANISLQGKGLAGSVPESLSRLTSLTGLYLHYNSLKGEIPKQISELSLLTDLYLNILRVSALLFLLPSALQLCCNRLEGSIPKELGSLKKLSVLALQNNRLTGAIPATLGDLTSVTRLDLSSNELFGSIPSRLASLPQLTVLDVHNNSLSGTVPGDLKRLKQGFHYENNKDLCGLDYDDLRACTSSDPFSKQGDGKPVSVSPKIPESANVQQSTACAGRSCLNGAASSYSPRSSRIAVFVVVVALVGGSLVCSLFLFSWYRRRKQKIGSAFETSDGRCSATEFMAAKDFSRKSASPLISVEYANGWDPLPDEASNGGSLSAFHFPSQDDAHHSYRFNLEEVESATQYFSEVNLLGKSNFSSVHRGILRDGSVVAVRTLNKTSCKTSEDDFQKGLKILSSLRHEHLVKLRGFCCSRGRGECFLVYDFVPNGSLVDYLDIKADDGGLKLLEWSTRVWIINGIAKAIEYLHGSMDKPSLVHQNISAEKVLLDQHFNPLLSSSGLHKLLADDVVFSTLKASAAMGYLAPEYMTIGRFTKESDVYAFGVLVLQILSGKRRVSLTMRQAAESGNLEDFIDCKLQGHYSITEAMSIVRISLCCTSESPSHRPSMSTVVQELSSRSS